MKQLRFSAFVMAVALVAMLGASALAVADETFKAILDGYQETPAAISTTGEGEFQAKINDSETVIAFKLSYHDLEGGNPSAAHIHLGRPGVSGGVIAFLCGGGSKPPCPDPPGTVMGTIVATDVIGPATQGIAPEEIDELIAAMRARATYVNVHNATYPSGEIRGAVTKGKKKGN